MLLGKVRFTYNKYDQKFIKLTEEEFYLLKMRREEYPYCDVIYIKNIFDLINELLKEFGLIILIFFLLFIIPLFLWLIFGGFISIINFVEDFNYNNAFNKKLNLNFDSLESYEDYTNFFLYEKL